jgi:hypothetical protein
MALKHIYSEIWVECVVRSPLYRPDIQVDPIVEGKENSNIDSSSLRFSISSTNFEAKLVAFYEGNHSYFVANFLITSNLIRSLFG